MKEIKGGKHNLPLYLWSECFGEDDTKAHHITLYKKIRFVMTSSSSDFSVVDWHKIPKQPISGEDYAFTNKSYKKKDNSRIAPCTHNPKKWKKDRWIVWRINEDVVKKLLSTLNVIQQNNRENEGEIAKEKRIKISIFL